MRPRPAVDPRPLVARAVGLLRELGVQPGERLLTVLPNDVATFAVGVACALEGVVEVPTPRDLPAADLAAVVRDAAPFAAVVDPALLGDRLPVLRDALAAVADGGADGEASGSGPAARRRPGSGVVVALRPGGLDAYAGVAPSGAWPRTRPMAYTSGTTGRRKGVFVGVHDAAWGEAWLRDEAAAFDDRHGDVHLVVSPLYHSGPFRHALVTALTSQQPRVAVLPAFDGEALRAALREVRPTSVFCVPTHLRRLLAAGVTRDDLASVRLLLHAGAPCPTATKEAVLELAPDGAVWEFYGSTEGQFTTCPPDAWRGSPGTVGTARPGCRLEVRRADGSTTDADEVGIVWNHVPAHARFAYWQDEARTAEAWSASATHDGAFTVGDLGSLDAAGRLTLAGRPGDLVISGGVNVYPAEVERVLLEHPAVAEAVVTGIPDDEWGQRVVAAVVPWPGHDLDGEALRDWARPRLAAARLPKQVLVTDELPRTPTGKVRRVDLATALGLA